MFQHVKPDFK